VVVVDGQQPQLGQRQVGDAAVPSQVRSTVVVVDDDRHAVGAQLHVQFDAVGPLRQGQGEGGQGVFRRVGRRAAMADDERTVGLTRTLPGEKEPQITQISQIIRSNLCSV
jgi:hypothetical protein